jgi:hypothetical protein
MTDKVDTTAPADEMAGEATTDEDQIWKELAAEEAAAAGEDPEAAELEEQLEEDATIEGETGEEPGADDDDALNDDQNTAETDDGNGDGAEADSDEDTQTPTLEELQTQTKDLEQKFRSEQSRSIAQQKRADRLQKELDAIKRRKDANGNAEQAEDRLASLSEEYGDVVGPLVDEVKSLKGRFKDLSDADEQRTEVITEELREMQEKEIATFEETHPDGMDVVKDNAEVFQEWIEDQPKVIRDAYTANLDRFVDGTAAALVVSHFKAALQEASQGNASQPAEGEAETADPQAETQTDKRLERRRSRQLAGAAATRTTGSQKVSSDLPPDTEDEEALWKYWEAQDAKKARSG